MSYVAGVGAQASIRTLTQAEAEVVERECANLKKRVETVGLIFKTQANIEELTKKTTEFKDSLEQQQKEKAELEKKIAAVRAKIAAKNERKR